MRDDSKAAADAFGLRGEIVAFDEDPAGRGARESGHETHQGCLARAIRPEDAKRPARWHFGVDPVEGGQGSKSFGDSLYLYLRRGHGIL